MPFWHPTQFIRTRARYWQSTVVAVISTSYQGTTSVKVYIDASGHPAEHHERTVMFEPALNGQTFQHGDDAEDQALLAAGVAAPRTTRSTKSR